MKYLCMKSGTVPIVVSPNRDNIRFTVLKADKDLHCFEWVISMIKEKKSETPYTIIFCKTVNDIVLVLNYFLTKLGNSIYVDGNEPAHERVLLGIYYYNEVPLPPKIQRAYFLKWRHYFLKWRHYFLKWRHYF